MQRRDLLGTFAVAGIAGLAGCSETSTAGGGSGNGNGDSDGNDDGSGNGDGGGTDDGGDAETTSGEDEAALAIARAVSTLNTVAIRLNKTRDRLDTPEEIDLDEDTLLDGIERARGALDTATETATDAQVGQVETLRNLATVLENLTLVVATVHDVRPESVVAETKAAVDEKDYDDALALVRDAKSSAETARERTRTATDALRGVDPDRLAAVDGVAYAKVEDAVAETHGLASAFVTVTSGYEPTLQGAQDLEAGRDDAEAKRYAEAREGFGQAATHFETADETFATVRADAPASIDTQIGTARCQTTHLLAASEAFEKAASAAEDGDLADSKQYREEGETEYENVDDCGSN